jgi:heme O synthase-like polyprenyltransferase
VSGSSYAVIAAAVGAGLLVAALRFAASRSDVAARRLFFGSLIYLPLIWIAMIADKL